MARARNIKPGFFKNEDLAECSMGARLLFPGLWMLADREGRLEDRPRRIKGEIFPFDTFDVEPLLDELENWKFIRRYAVEGRRFIQVLKFLEHQNPHGTEKNSEIPDENGFYTAHDRNKNHCVTGTWRLVAGFEWCDNRYITVKQPLDNALNPDSLNPDSLIRGSKQQQGATREAREEEKTPKPQNQNPESFSKSPPDQPTVPDPAPTDGIETPPSGKPQPMPAAAPDADAITLRALEIAVLLRQRGAGLAPGDVRLRSWAERGITDAALLTALETAERRRVAAGSPQQVNAGLLDAILADAGATGPPARASPRGGGKQAQREAYRAAAEDAAQRLNGLNFTGGSGHGRVDERDITGECAVVA